jgi:hypothetical protein
MQTTNLEQLREDAAAVIAAAQNADIQVISEGKVVAVVSRPRPVQGFDEYWQKREEQLREIVLDVGWDSTKAIEEDRNRE